jgi:prophage tail gpP-like protein
MSSSFALLVGGELYSGWQSLRITRGVERATADFDLSVSERWPLHPDEPSPWQIQPGDTCEIRLIDDGTEDGGDGDTVLTGYVDAYRPSYDANSHAVRLSGRSKTCDFVDSSVMVPFGATGGGQFKGMTVAEIARLLAQPFGIEVVAEIEGEPEPEVQVQQGETCFALVERLSRLQELLITDDALGRLVLTRAGSGHAATALRHGVNILSASANLDNSRRFSEYVVKAQRPGNRTRDGGGSGGGGDDWGEVEPTRRRPDGAARACPWPEQGAEPGGRQAAWQRLKRIPNISARYREEMRLRNSGDGPSTAPQTLTQIVGTARDPGITRYRPHLIVAEAQSDDAVAEKRADWEMRRRLAQAVRATITVHGWHQEDRRLWAANDMVWVEAPWLALERELIIAEVSFHYGDGGEITEFNLTLPDAFLPKAKRKGKREKKVGAGGGGGRKTGGSGGDPWADVAPTS